MRERNKISGARVTITLLAILAGGAGSEQRGVGMQKRREMVEKERKKERKEEKKQRG